MTDELDLLEAQGRAERAVAKAERNTPANKGARNRGRAQRNRGLRCERKFAQGLAEYGFRRVPMSGAMGGGSEDDPWSGDINRREGIVRRVEVKRREGGCKQIRAWLEQGGADALLVDTGGRDMPLVVVRLDTFKRYLEVERDG